MSRVQEDLVLAPPAAGHEALLALIEDALALLDEERDVFLTGAYGRIAGISERKLDILAELEVQLAQAERSVLVINAVRRLIAASRRNEQIIEAARQGLSHARRRIGAIQEAARGVVAYAEDGTRIASQADLRSREQSA